MPTKDKLVFSVTREDLLYDYAATFEDVFHFSPNGESNLSGNTGVRFQDHLHTDFLNETAPVVKIHELSDALTKELGEDASKFSVYVSLEDTSLGMRQIVLSKPVDELAGGLTFKIDLHAFPEFGYFKGYVVKCFIARSQSVAPTKSKVWSKSNIIHQSEFIVKATVNEALFEIAWTDFSDQQERKDLLYCINWFSHEVSQESHSQTFQVLANNDLKNQFKRLENNKLFGGLAIRLIVDRIIAELAEVTLLSADLETEPLEGSLHEQMIALFESFGMDFITEAERYQSGEKAQMLDTRLRVNRAIQKSHKVASTLMSVKFGGFRK